MTKKIIIAAFIFISVSVGYFFFNKNQKSKSSQDTVSVETRSMDITILATGTVQPQNRLEIKAPIAGRIDQVLCKEGDHVRKGQTLAWMSSTERAAMLDSAASQGPSEVKRWEELYRATPILSPISGTIILRNIESGQTITNNEAILVLSDRLSVKAQVDETDIAEITKNQKVKIILDAYPENIIMGKVTDIAYEAQVVNNVTTYIVDIVPDQIPPFMRSGMTSNVTFMVEEIRNTIAIPTETIRFKDGKPYVSVLGPNGSNDKPISTGKTDGKFTQVINGLDLNDKIISEKTISQKGGGNSGSPLTPKGPRGSGPR